MAGPFKMSEWAHQDHITLVPNEYYFGSPAKLKKITLFMQPDLNAAYAAYLNNEVDVLGQLPPAVIDAACKISATAANSPGRNHTETAARDGAQRNGEGPG